ncbi:hypothetical protein ABI59_17550 [Acidobacteria bacterium Mor1]|nr:hypothetical protein ABI59_17550 [Acidobacteria bacterium Mor1]
MRFLFIALLTAVSAIQAAEWRYLRGPGFDGSAAGPAVLSESPQLKLEWKHAIGPGYSGVTVAAGRAVSAFSDGTHDVVAAWSTTDGRELWRTPIGRTYRGHDGSTDGPVGTATLTDSRVYFVGPFGDLFALAAEDGKILWRKNLETDWGAQAPTYGFATIPLEVDGVLVVPAGSEKHSVVGLDPETGRQLWSHGTDRIDYSTPVIVESDGRRQVIVAGALELMALDPKSGKQLWSYRHSEERGFDPTYPQLQLVGDRFLMMFYSEAALFDVAADSETTKVTEVWRSQALKSSVALPVAVGDHLYGFNGTFLTCVELETGESVWKSRDLPGRGILRLDDHFVVFGSKGKLTLAKADPAGYRETASLVISDHGGYTAPSFAGGRIYVRNRSEIASVAIGASGTASRRAETSLKLPTSGEFARWMQRIEQAPDDPGKLVGEFLAAHPESPIVEPGWVHFFYAGEADAVSIIGQMNDAEMGETMTRVGRADLFVRSYPAVAGGRWQYQFQVDLADAQVDPRNPNRGSGGFAETSEVLLEGFSDPAFVTEKATATGTLETVEVTSAAYGEKVPVQIYLPSGFDRDERYPLIVMPNGDQWIEDGQIVGILDRLFETRPGAAIVALVPIRGWVAGSWGGNALTFLGEELLPAIEAAYPIHSDPQHRALWTVEDKAAVGTTLAVEHPGIYGRFVFQSPKLYFQEAPDFSSLADRATPFRISWSRYEPLSAESGTDDRAAARELFERIRAAGLPLEGGEFIAGPGYRTWRTEAEAILSFLLAEAPSER